MKTQGLTIVEVLIAILVLAIAMTALNTLFVGNYVQNASTGKLSQAIQLVNYFGRRVSGADSALLPSTTSPLSYNYNTLRTNFPDLPSGADFGNPNNYRASITNRGSWSNAAANNIVLSQYRIQVCWRTTEGERCTQADTLGYNSAANNISN